ncbi:MAG: DUF4375 domain-containing protein [Polyangiaceae bacterium]|nr:DUF4375 domain-containing protein [Polyangiaceae bacterium]
MTSELESSWQALCVRWDQSGYAALSEDERVWFNLRSLIDSVENGGLISYFYNAGADTIEDCRTALRRLNALKILTQVDRVAGLFGADVPRTVNERNAVIDSWLHDDAREMLLGDVDAELMPLVRDLDEQLEFFVVKHGLVGRG